MTVSKPSVSSKLQASCHYQTGTTVRSGVWLAGEDQKLHQTASIHCASTAQWIL